MRVQIAPSILSFDMGDIRRSVVELVSGGADLIHFDVMDGQFVPPITFGSGLVKDLRAVVETPFEAHLMTSTPDRHFDAFAAAGCSRIIFHAETTAHAHRLVGNLHERGVQAGLAINPGTPVEAVMPLLDVLDLVLVMTVNPGWGGQSFIPSCLDKVRRIRQAAPRLPIEVDGGIDPDTIRSAHDAGATVFVVGSYLARAESIPCAMEDLRQRCL